MASTAKNLRYTPPKIASHNTVYDRIQCAIRVSQKQAIGKSISRCLSPYGTISRLYLHVVKVWWLLGMSEKVTSNSIESWKLIKVSNDRLLSIISPIVKRDTNDSIVLLTSPWTFCTFQ